MTGLLFDRSKGLESNLWHEQVSALYKSLGLLSWQDKGLHFDRSKGLDSTLWHEQVSTLSQEQGSTLLTWQGTILCQEQVYSLPGFFFFYRSKRVLFNSGKGLLDKSKGPFLDKRKSKGLLLTKAKDYSWQEQGSTL